MLARFRWLLALRWKEGCACSDAENSTEDNCDHAPSEKASSAAERDAKDGTENTESPVTKRTACDSAGQNEHEA